MRLSRVIFISITFGVVFQILFLRIVNQFFDQFSSLEKEERFTIDPPKFHIERDLFEPGSLNESRVKVATQCFVGNKTKQYFFPRVGEVCSYSQKYNLFFKYVPKTGSSTQKEVLRSTFRTQNITGCLGLNVPSNAFKVIATRDPVERFISGVKEVLLRGNIFGQRNKEAFGANIPIQYKDFLQSLNHTSIPTRNLQYSKEAEDMKLKMQLVEEFIRNYDGKNAFDPHIQPILSSFLHRPGSQDLIEFDMALESSTLNEDFEALARHVGAHRPKPSHARIGASTSPFAMHTYQKVCQLVKHDLCCLNYKLPEACARSVGQGERVMCERIMTSSGEKRIIGVLV